MASSFAREARCECTPSSFTWRLSSVLSFSNFVAILRQRVRTRQHSLLALVKQKSHSHYCIHHLHYPNIVIGPQWTAHFRNFSSCSLECLLSSYKNKAHNSNSFSWPASQSAHTLEHLHTIGRLQPTKLSSIKVKHLSSRSLLSKWLTARLALTSRTSSWRVEGQFHAIPSIQTDWVAYLRSFWLRTSLALLQARCRKGKSLLFNLWTHPLKMADSAQEEEAVSWCTYL